MALIIDGKKISTEIKDETRDKVAELKEQSKEYEQIRTEAEEELTTLLCQIPNIPYDEAERIYDELSELETIIMLDFDNEPEYYNNFSALYNITFGYDEKDERALEALEEVKLMLEGYDIYVGKNNYQNDELTFKFATGNDWWFHAKGIPGSHVVVKANNEELPDKTFEEAAALAAFYSKGRDSEKVEIDYLQKKNVKKPSGAAPGFVVYYTNFSLLISPDISSIEYVD